MGINFIKEWKNKWKNCENKNLDSVFKNSLIQIKLSCTTYKHLFSKCFCDLNCIEEKARSEKNEENMDINKACFQKTKHVFAWPHR